MENKETLKKRVENLKDQAYQGKFVLINFVDDITLREFEKAFKKVEPIQPFSYGGYPESEYKRLIISAEEPSAEAYQITCLKINYSKKNYEINHRMVLGSILGLGLKREVVGDIVLASDDYYVFVTTKMAGYIKDNLKYIGRVPVNLEETIFTGEVKKEFLVKDCFLASMRLDVVLAGFYNLSRKEALELVSDNLVKVNHKETMNNSQILEVGDILSVRGKGRLIVEEIKGKTKSGNLVVKLKKPL